MVIFDDGAELLSQAECQALLAGASIGRVSLTVDALPVVLPVAYQYLGGDVILSTDDGPTRRVGGRGAVIALGVDSAERAEPFWALVVIGHGTEITDPAELAEYQSLGLAAPNGNGQSHYLRIRPDILTGYRNARH